MKICDALIACVLLAAAGCSNGDATEAEPVRAAMESGWAEDRNIEPIDAASLDASTDTTGDAVVNEAEPDMSTMSEATDGVDASTRTPAIVEDATVTGGSCSDGKRVCGDMASCEDAVFHLEQCGMTRLDGDSDGTPCEKICG